jgi:uncharacterized membrane protein YfcA
LEIAFLCGFAFLAGFIDSIVGGGGLIQLPALFIFMPNLPVATVFGTGKLPAISGTTAAMFRYSRNVQIRWQAVLPAAVIAFVFSFIGARAVSLINTEVVKPVIIVLLISVAIYTFIRKDFGGLHAPKLDALRERVTAGLVGLIIGFYDGFFGPGTGSFLIFAFIGLFGFSFLSASASAKVVNVATNLSALLYFAATDNIIYHIAIPMSVCNILGSLVGSKLALVKGSGFVRKIFLVVVSIMILKLVYDTFLK